MLSAEKTLFELFWQGINRFLTKTVEILLPVVKSTVPQVKSLTSQVNLQSPFVDLRFPQVVSMAVFVDFVTAQVEWVVSAGQIGITRLKLALQINEHLWQNNEPWEQIDLFALKIGGSHQSVQRGKRIFHRVDLTLGRPESQVLG